MNIPKELLKIAKILVSSISEKEVERLLGKILQGTSWRGKLHAVGGYVRDEFMGLDAKDLDIVVSVKDGSEKFTKWLQRQFPKEISTPRKMGAGYPIWQITFKDNIEFKNETFATKGAVIEFADTMREKFPDARSRQREVEYGSLKEDIERRDFTVNMLLKDLSSGEIVDLTGTSKSDIQRGILRGHPDVDLSKIFRDDPLRMIRLIRFQSKYNWSIPKFVLRTVRNNASRVKIVSSERIMDELTKVMKLGKLSQAIRLMKATGLLRHVFPEVQEMVGVQQPKQYHREGDVFKHTVNVLRNAPPTIEGQLAALLHDVGKPKSQTIVGGAIQFLGHDKVGAEIAEAILRRLKFDTGTIKKVVTIVKNHMRPYNLVDASDKAIRKFIRDFGEELTDAVLDQADADERGSIPIQRDVPKVRDRVRKVRDAPIKVQTKPVLDGREIMRILGITSRDKERLPEIGRASQFLLEIADEYASTGRELSKRDAEMELRKI